MRYTGNTVSKPVVGRAAEKLSKALLVGGYVSNDAAKETIRQIVEHRKHSTTTSSKQEGSGHVD